MLASVAAYSAVADRYEATHASKGRARVERFAGSLPTPSLILDAGCGPGRDLARFTALGHVARGIDLNPEFVARANVYAPTWCGDLREVVRWFPPHMFDGIWADAALVHLSDVEAADVLGQFHELLRPAAGSTPACTRRAIRDGGTRPTADAGTACGIPRRSRPPSHRPASAWTMSLTDPSSRYGPPATGDMCRLAQRSRSVRLQIWASTATGSSIGTSDERP